MIAHRTSAAQQTSDERAILVRVWREVGGPSFRARLFAVEGGADIQPLGSSTSEVEMLGLISEWLDEHVEPRDG